MDMNSFINDADIRNSTFLKVIKCHFTKEEKEKEEDKTIIITISILKRKVCL